MSTCSLRRGTGPAGTFRFVLVSMGLAWAAVCGAGELKVRVLDKEGRPVPDVVVAAQGRDVKVPAPAQAATMDQVGRQFVPRILVVQAGASVAFPNSDTVSHQVYSFSPTKRFQLPLYRGQSHPPLTFPEPGIVVLGCNIHDSMIGYIYVAPGPNFGKTGADGSLVLKDLSTAEYRLSVWSPRFDEPSGQITRTVTVSDSPPAQVDIRLTRKLRPEPGKDAGSHDY